MSSVKAILQLKRTGEGNEVNKTVGQHTEVYPVSNDIGQELKYGAHSDQPCHPVVHGSLVAIEHLAPKILTCQRSRRNLIDTLSRYPM